MALTKSLAIRPVLKIPHRMTGEVLLLLLLLLILPMLLKLHPHRDVVDAAAHRRLVPNANDDL